MAFMDMSTYDASLDEEFWESSARPGPCDLWNFLFFECDFLATLLLKVSLVS